MTDSSFSFLFDMDTLRATELIQFRNAEYMVVRNVT